MRLPQNKLSLLLGEHGEAARVIAGGQDILFRMKKYIVTPTVLVNLKTIPGLNQIRHEKNVGLRIGPLATLSQIAASADVRVHYNALAQAAHVVASPQIRNFGTIGGNLCQDVWCWYLARRIFLLEVGRQILRSRRW